MLFLKLKELETVFGKKNFIEMTRFPEYFITPSKFYNTELGLVDHVGFDGKAPSGLEVRRKHCWHDKVLVKTTTIDEAMHSSLQVDFSVFN